MATYPIPKFHFQVDWGGTRIGFTEVTGLTIENEVIEYREGNSPEYNKIKMPGLQKFGNITLKPDIFASDYECFAWLNPVKLNNIERRDVIISLLNENHEPVVVYKVKQAWPVKIQAPDLKSDANVMVIESVDLAHEGLMIDNG
jgi:phage tail-like protein